MSQRLWVQIPTLFTGWTFFTFEKTEITEKEAGVGRLTFRNYLAITVLGK